ncbi:hypothetical protein [Pseudomonas nicosulfuronedens]
MDISFDAHRWSSTDDLQQVIDSLATQLLAKRTTAGRNWPNIAAQIANSDIAAFMRQCPMTHHAFRQPRGYPGDALLLDYAYGIWQTSSMKQRNASPRKRESLLSLPANFARWSCRTPAKEAM